MSSFILLFTMQLLAIAGRAGLEMVPGATSPHGHFALAVDEINRRECLWRVSLPGRKPIGQPGVVDHFVGLPSRGYSVWNEKACRVAVGQGGIPYERTIVFQYSRAGLRELALPDLEALPEKWYPKATVDRCYVYPERWLGRDRLQLSVWGTLRPEFSDYHLKVIVRWKRGGQSRIVRVVDSPLEMP